MTAPRRAALSLHRAAEEFPVAAQLLSLFSAVCVFAFQISQKRDMPSFDSIWQNELMGHQHLTGLQ